MAVDNQEYTLTLNNVLSAIEAYKRNDAPIPIVFWVQHKLTLNELAKLKMLDPLNMKESPLKEDTVLKSKQNQCFSKNLKKLACSNCKQLTQGMLLFFLLGGYSRFAAINADSLSYLFNGGKRAQGLAEEFAEDLVKWKAIPEVNGTWTIVDIEDIKDKRFPRGPLSIIQFIAMRNEAFIKEFCGSKSQEALRKILHDFAVRCYDEEQILDKGVVPMDLGIVEILAEYLGLLARMAEISKGRGKQPKYLAEGLTWLLSASLLREKFPPDSAEFYYAVDNAHKAADEMGVVGMYEIPMGVGMPSPDHDMELYGRLMRRFRDIRDQHPSIRMMMDPDPLFPEGLPVISNAERTAAEGNGDPVSIKDMVQRSWAEHKHLLLTGEGGIGKTVCMLRLPDEEWISGLPIPVIYIPLQRLDIYKGDLNSYINSVSGSDDKRIADLAGESWEKHPKLLLLLDGFNEVPVEYRQTAERWIRVWMDKPAVQVITTSRISFSLDRRFLEYTLQPLPLETVRGFLLSSGLGEEDLPGSGNLVWKVLTVPLMLTMYIQADRVREMAGGSDRSSILEWKEPDNSAHIIWNYLQAELYRLIIADDSASVLSAAAVLAVAPFVCYEMAKRGQFYIEQEDFHKTIHNAVQFYSQNKEMLPAQYEKIRKRFLRGRKETPFEDTACEKHFSVLTEQSALFQEKENADNNDRYEIIYVPTHQNFLDALAAIFISGCMLNSVKETLPFPEGILAAADSYVKDYISEFLTDRELVRVWDYHRTREPENGRVTWILMDILGRQRDYDFSELDFSGLDLTKTSLHRLVSKRLDICPLPKERNKFKNTMIIRDTLYPEGHTSSVHYVSYSDTGMLLASGSSYGTIRIWDLEGGENRVLEEPSGSVKNFIFGPESGLLTSASRYGTIRIWNLNNRTNRVLGKHQGGVVCMSYNPKTSILASGGNDGTIRIWNVENGKYRILNGHTAAVTCIACDPNKSFLASGGEDGIIRIWDIENQTNYILGEHIGGVIALAYDQKRNCLASVSKYGIVYIWDLNCKENQILGSCADEVASIAYDLRRDCLACGTREGKIYIWDLESRENYVLYGHTKCVNSLVYDPRRDCLASGSDDGTIRIWDIERRKSRVFEGHTEWIRCIAYDPRMSYLASGSEDRTVRIWDQVSEKYRILRGHTGWVRCVAYDPRRNCLASGSEDGMIRIWNLDTEECKVLEGHTGCVRSLTYGFKTDCLTSGSEDGTVRIWNLENGKSKVLNYYSTPVLSLAFSPRNNHLAIGTNDGKVCIYDLENEITHILGIHYDGVTGLTYDPEGNFLASCSMDRTIRIWNLENTEKTTQEYQILSGHTGWVRGIAYDLKINSLVSCGDDGTIRIWNLKNGTSQILGEHQGGASCVVYDPENDHVASCSEDGTIRIWDTTTKTELKCFRIIPQINLSGANFEAAVMSEEDKEFFKQAGAKVD